MRNSLIVGDSIKILSGFHSKIASLIYLDPPFFSGRSFFANAGKPHQKKVFDDTWTGGLTSYLDWAAKLMRECRRVLRDDGSLYLHCDQHASHYLKVELDRAFGIENFRNEIIWTRHKGHNDWLQGARHFGRVHDIILFYTVSDNYVWNRSYEPYDPKYVERAYRYAEQETGRAFALGDLTGPGGASKGNPRFEFLGVIRNWRFSRATMTRLLREGRIVQRSPGAVPLLKRYLGEMKGTQVQDVWSDIAAVNRGKEKVGYPTQKPIDLMKRIISFSSNRDDLVIDPLFGSGSFLVAASLLRRRWIGIDSSEYATSIALKRIMSLELETPRVCYQGTRNNARIPKMPAK